MGFSKLSKRIRGRIFAESESHVAEHCAFIISTEHTYIFEPGSCFCGPEDYNCPGWLAEALCSRVQGSSGASRALTSCPGGEPAGCSPCRQSSALLLAALSTAPLCSEGERSGTTFRIYYFQQHFITVLFGTFS